MPDVIHRAVEEYEFRHVLLDEFEVRIAAEVDDVVHTAGDKIVNADDLVAAGNEQVGEVRAEKTGGPGDNRRLDSVFFIHNPLEMRVVCLQGDFINFRPELFPETPGSKTQNRGEQHAKAVGVF